jgi:hypothetical protein
MKEYQQTQKINGKTYTYTVYVCRFCKNIRDKANREFKEAPKVRL